MSGCPVFAELDADRDPGCRMVQDCLPAAPAADDRDGGCRGRRRGAPARVAAARPAARGRRGGIAWQRFILLGAGARLGSSAVAEPVIFTGGAPVGAALDWAASMTSPPGTRPSAEFLEEEPGLRPSMPWSTSGRSIAPSGGGFLVRFRLLIVASPPVASPSSRWTRPWSRSAIAAEQQALAERAGRRRTPRARRAAHAESTSWQPRPSRRSRRTRPSASCSPSPPAPWSRSTLRSRPRSTGPRRPMPSSTGGRGRSRTPMGSPRTSPRMVG